jgi:hypothetical protein
MVPEVTAEPTCIAPLSTVNVTVPLFTVTPVPVTVAFNVTVWLLALYGTDAFDAVVTVACATVSVADVVEERVPLVPVIVRGYVPPGVLAAVKTVNSVGPNPISQGGAKVAEAPDGSPLTDKLTVPPNAAEDAATLTKMEKLEPGAAGPGELPIDNEKFDTTFVNCEAVKACV